MSTAKPAKESKGITVSVMGREFRVAPPPGEERQLMASVDYLNKKLKELKDTGKVVGNERLAILVALNIAHEYLQSQGAPSASKLVKSANNSIDEDFVQRKMNDFEAIIEKAISEQEKLF